MITVKRIENAEECEQLIKEQVDNISSDQDKNITIFHNVLGLVLKKLRLKSGKTQSKVAEWFGVTFQQVQKYENGVNKVPFHFVFIFCERMKCSMNEFTKYFNDINISGIKNENANTNAKEITCEQPNA